MVFSEEIAQQTAKALTAYDRLTESLIQAQNIGDTRARRIHELDVANRRLQREHEKVGELVEAVRKVFAAGEPRCMDANLHNALDLLRDRVAKVRTARGETDTRGWRFLEAVKEVRGE